MRKTIAGGVLFVCVIVMAGIVYARGPMGDGSNPCDRSDCPNNSTAATAQWQKFKTDSLELREQMMTKRFELEKEELAKTPDNAKITRLQTEISALRIKLQDLREKSGLTGYGPSGGFRNNGRMNCGDNNYGTMQNCRQGMGCRNM